MDQEITTGAANDIANPGQHTNSFFSLFIRGFQEMLKFFKYIFYDVIRGRNP